MKTAEEIAGYWEAVYDDRKGTLTVKETIIEALKEYGCTWLQSRLPDSGRIADMPKISHPDMKCSCIGDVLLKWGITPLAEFVDEIEEIIKPDSGRVGEEKELYEWVTELPVKSGYYTVRYFDESGNNFISENQGFDGGKWMYQYAPNGVHHKVHSWLKRYSPKQAEGEDDLNYYEFWKEQCETIKKQRKEIAALKAPRDVPAIGFLEWAEPRFARQWKDGKPSAWFSLDDLLLEEPLTTKQLYDEYSK